MHVSLFVYKPRPDRILFITSVHMHDQTSWLPISSQGMKRLLQGYPFISQIYHALSKHTDTKQRQVSLPLTWSSICQLSIRFFKNDLLVNTSENQILLVAKLLEGCHNKSSFTLRLLHRLKGNLMMLGKSQKLLIFAPKNINIKNFLQSTSDLR